MSNNSTISISFKIGGDKDGFKQLSLDADGFKKIIGQTIKETERLKNTMINFAAVATGIDSVSKTLTDMRNVMKDLTAAHSAQIQVETQLAVNMRNTMGATEQEIQSIKDLCSAQQLLGIVGDEVQLAGAQKMALFLSEKQSLDALIPAMNDLAAAQFGFNVTQENAAQIATALGKALTGQATALKRYGLIFSEAQEQIMKYGTEADKVAVICEVVSNSVGGMNAELANTPDGKVKQLENYFGDLKETIGGLAQLVMPYLEWLNYATVATLGVIKLCAAMAALIRVCNEGKKVIVAFWATTAKIESTTTGLTKSVATARLFLTEFGHALTQGTKGLKLFAMAWRGLLVSTGVGIAIAALTTLIYKLVSASDDAADSLKQFDDVNEEYTRSAADAKVKIDNEIASLGELIKSNDDTTDAVNRLNAAYAQYMGKHDTAAEWYDTLINKSKDYIKCIGYEAEAMALREKAYKAAVEKDKADDLVAELEASGRHKEKRNIAISGGSITGATSYYTAEVETEEYKQAKKAQAEAAAEQERIEKALDKAVSKVEALRSSVNATNPTLEVSAMDWDQVTAAINETEASLRKTLDPEKIKQLRAYNDQLHARKAILDKILGLSKTGTAPGKPELTDPDKTDELDGYLELKAKREYLEKQLSETADFLTRERYKRELEYVNEVIKQKEFLAKLQIDGVKRVEYNPIQQLTPTLPSVNEDQINGFVAESAALKEMNQLWQEKIDKMRDAGTQAKETTEVIANAVGSMGSSLSNLGNAFELPALNVAGTIAQAVATLALSYAKMMAENKFGPIGWLAFGATGLAELVSMVTTIKNLPAFAKGGIISGPTVGLMGEYPGAANNPEVVAPLNTLNKLLEPAGPGNLKVETKLKAHDLYLVIEYYKRKLRRT